YSVVGAFAVSFHGIPRSTQHADVVVWLQNSGKTAADITARSIALGYSAVIRRGNLDDPILEAAIVNDIYQNQVALIFGLRGMDPDAASRSVSESFLDSSIRIIAAEDLIAMKVHAGGPQDLLDVRGILAVSGDSMDYDLLRRLIKRYGPDMTRTFEDLLRQLNH